MDKIYILIERGGQYESSWTEFELASFNKEYLEQLAQEHNKNNKRRRFENITYKEVETIAFIKK